MKIISIILLFLTIINAQEDSLEDNYEQYLGKVVND